MACVRGKPSAVKAFGTGRADMSLCDLSVKVPSCQPPAQQFDALHLRLDPPAAVGPVCAPEATPQNWTRSTATPSEFQIEVDGALAHLASDHLQDALKGLACAFWRVTF